MTISRRFWLWFRWVSAISNHCDSDLRCGHLSAGCPFFQSGLHRCFTIAVASLFPMVNLLFRSAWSTVRQAVRDQLGPSWSQYGQVELTWPSWSSFCCVFSFLDQLGPSWSSYSSTLSHLSCPTSRNIAILSLRYPYHAISVSPKSLPN